MASKAEITAAIRDGIDRVDGTFGGLTDDQLAMKVHDGPEGWTARDILAHLAGRERGYGLMFRMAESTTPPTGGFDVDAWNKARIAERSDRSPAELLAEFRTVHEALIGQIDAQPDEALARTVNGFRGPVEFGEMMRGSGGAHSVGHAVEVDQALGLSA